MCHLVRRIVERRPERSALADRDDRTNYFRAWLTMPGIVALAGQHFVSAHHRHGQVFDLRDSRRRRRARRVAFASAR